MGWLRSLATAVILLNSTEGFCQGIPWDITLTAFTAASEKVVLKRIVAYINGYGFISGEITNNTGYDLIAHFSIYLKDAAGDLIEVDVANDIRGEDVVILGDGSLLPYVIKPGKSGFFKWVYYSAVPADAKTYSLVVDYKTVAPYLRGDLDNDGDVDFDDFFILADNFGKAAALADAQADSLSESAREMATTAR